jgi:hypothetical protein
MSTKVDVDVTELWREFKEHPTTELRNQLVERYLPLVKYNAERIWQRLPEGVDLDDLISAGVFGLMDAIEAFDLSRGGKVELKTIKAPKVEFKSATEVFESALEHEKSVTKSINDVMDTAIKENDHAVNSFLKWYVD